MRGGNLLDLILTNKEVLAGDVKDKGSLGCIDQEVVESLVARPAFRNPMPWRLGESLEQGRLLVEEDWVREHLSKLNIHSSMGPGGMNAQVLRELADEGYWERCLRTGGEQVSFLSSKRS